MSKMITHFDKEVIHDEVTDNLSIFNPHTGAGLILDDAEAKELYEFLVQEYKFGTF